jgi:diguanylate cyclase (GGDEF)-like protein/PAS domain S-box-containing protein
MMDDDPHAPGGIDPTSVIANLPDLVALVDADGTIRWVGPNVPASLAWKPHELVGRTMFDLFAKEVNFALHVDGLAKVLAEPGLHGPIGVTVVAGDGRLREVEIMVTHALDERAGPLVASCRDVTGRGTELEDLRQSEAWASILMRGTTDVVVVCDLQGGIGYVSPSVQRVLGHEPSGLVGRSVVDLVHREDLLAGPEGLPLDRVLGTGAGRRPVLRFGEPDGTWTRLRVERTSTEHADRSVVLTCREVSEEDAVANLLNEQTLLLERIARGDPVGDTLRGLDQLVSHRVGGVALIVCFSDPDGSHRCEAPGLDEEVLDALTGAGIIPTPTHSRVVEPVNTYRRTDGWDAAVAAASGGTFTTAWVVDLVDARGESIGRVCLLRETTEAFTADEHDVLALVADLATIAIERHVLHGRLAHGALHDELTGLPNRRLLLERLRELFSTDEARGGLLFLDLDRFKLINDSLGHEAGDQLLREVSRRIGRILRTVDLVARVGGDEFVVLCPDLDGVDAVARLADRMAATLIEPVDLPGGRVVVSASIGVVHAVGSVEPTEVLQDADLAMYDAKQQGRSRVSVFHGDLRDGAWARMATENALRKALRSEEMELHFQPMVRLGTGHMVGAEALLRWERPGVGLVQPGSFVPVATDTGLILPLGRWVIEQVAVAAARWPTLEVAANLSARQLADVDLVDFVARTLAAHGVEAPRLCLEITEADLIDDHQLISDQLGALKALGVRLAIDDFGTGFATLDYLRRFATADVLKIDASFVAGVTDPSSHDMAIVSAAMVLAHNLGFEVVAEGVETEAQREVLMGLGCDLAQGYLFSEAVTAEDMDDLVASPGSSLRRVRPAAG